MLLKGHCKKKFISDLVWCGVAQWLKCLPGPGEGDASIFCFPQSRESARLFSSRPNSDFPTPSPVGDCVPLPLFPGGTLSNLDRWRGDGGPKSDDGTDTVVLCAMCIHPTTIHTLHLTYPFS